MAFSASDVAALEAAIKSGVLRVSYADRTVQYHSLDEMMKLLSLMRSEVAAGSSTTESCGRSTVGSFSRE